MGDEAAVGGAALSGRSGRSAFAERPAQKFKLRDRCRDVGLVKCADVCAGGHDRVDAVQDLVAQGDLETREALQAAPDAGAGSPAGVGGV